MLNKELKEKITKRLNATIAELEEMWRHYGMSELNTAIEALRKAEDELEVEEEEKTVASND